MSCFKHLTALNAEVLQESGCHVQAINMIKGTYIHTLASDVPLVNQIKMIV